MDTLQVIYIVQFTVPFYTAIICGLLFLKMYRKDDSPLGRRNLKWAILAFALSAFAWMSLVMYVSLPVVFAALNPLVLWSFMALHVMYYRFIFEITRVRADDKFPITHYIIPMVGFTVMLVWSFFVPFDVQISLVESRGVWVEEHMLYSALFTSKPFLFFIYDIVYALLGLRRTMLFRKAVVHYSADEQRSSLVWLYQCLFVMLAALPMTVLTLFLSKDQLIVSGVVMLPLAVAMLKDIILVHNVLLENFVLIKSDTLQLKQQQVDQLISEPVKQDDIEQFEAYMRINKPYLHTRLKITDMTVDLNTNRTSLSLLINRTYGMSFSRYINRLRLEELYKLKTDPDNANLSEPDLIAKAGFSDYRGYKRVKQREEFEF